MRGLDLVNLKVSYSMNRLWVVFFFNKFLNLFLAVLDLRFCARAFSSCGPLGTTLPHGARASYFRGLSCCRAQAPDAQAQ